MEVEVPDVKISREWGKIDVETDEIFSICCP